MIPTRIGQQFGGGYHAGLIRVGHTCYAIIVASKTTQTRLKQKNSDNQTTGTQSVNDGRTNTNAMNNNSHPAAQYCRSMNAGGYTDWYLPSRDELELCYRNLKPGTANNTTYAAGTYGAPLDNANGTNPNSDPVGAPYTTTNPAQTTATTFRTGGVEAFDESWYWTSTESSANTNVSLYQAFSDGDQDWTSKPNVTRVRGVRRVQI